MPKPALRCGVLSRELVSCGRCRQRRRPISSALLLRDFGCGLRPRASCWAKDRPPKKSTPAACSGFSRGAVRGRAASPELDATEDEARRLTSSNSSAPSRAPWFPNRQFDEDLKYRGGSACGAQRRTGLCAL